QRTDHLVGQLLERRALDRPARERVLQHAQVKTRLPRLGAKLRDAPDVQAAILRDDDRLGCRQLGRDFRDHRLLLLQIKTQGLPPCSIEKPATLNQEPCIAFPLRVRRLRGAMFRLRPYGPLRSLTAAVLSNSGPKSSFA